MIVKKPIEWSWNCHLYQQAHSKVTGGLTAWRTQPFSLLNNECFVCQQLTTALSTKSVDKCVDKHRVYHGKLVSTKAEQDCILFEQKPISSYLSVIYKIFIMLGLSPLQYFNHFSKLFKHCV